MGAQSQPAPAAAVDGQPDAAAVVTAPPALTVAPAAPAGAVVTQLPAPTPAPTQAATADSVVAGIRDALTAVFGTGPAWGPESPLAWAVLGWTRRQPAAALTQAVALPAQTTAQPAAADEHTGLPADLERVALVTDLNEPTDFRFLPNGAILISEKSGAIRVYQNNGLQQAPVIQLNGQTEVERGLSGIAVDPSFADNHYVYVSYTGADGHQRLSRLTVSGYTGDQTSDVLSAGSEQVMYRIPDKAANYHQGGGLAFGPDDKLYWGLGDNFDFNNPQDLGSPNGKILRLDVHNLNADGTATAPADNPFVNTAGALPEIYAYGFRNPFRFTFTPTGQMLEADVGGAAWEEINLVKPGANYGWPTAEGVCNGCGFANPIYAYAHTAPPLVAGAISSILVYTGDTLGPEYTNKVFIADYALNWMKTVSFDSEYSSFIADGMFDEEAGTTVQLLEGPDGKIYQLNIYPGTLSVIAPTGGNRAPTAVIDATPTNGLAPLAVSFSGAPSTDPEGAPLSYSWDFGDPTTTADVSTEANPKWQYATNGSYSVTLVVSDGEKTGQTNQRIVVGSTAPTATILTPANDTPYSAGDTISFSGEGTDAEDGTLPDSAYNWTVEFHHGDHVHPFADNIAGRSGTITIPTDESNLSNTWYRIILTVTDSSGLASSKSVDVKPRLVTVTFTTSDPEATYTIDGIPHTGTFTEQAVVGVKRLVDVASPQTTSTGPLIFGAWSDGGAQRHTITTPGTNTTYTVVFDDGTPHYVPPTGSLAGQVVDNQAANLRHVGDALGAATSALWATAVDLPFSLLNELATITGPAQIPQALGTLGQLVTDGLTRAITPLIDALTDVTATTLTRAVGVGAALTANLIPLTMAVVNAPVAVTTAVLDGLTIIANYVAAWDNLGIQSSLKFVPQMIAGVMAEQAQRILGAVNDVRDDTLAALSVGFPGEQSTPARFGELNAAMAGAAGEALKTTAAAGVAGLQTVAAALMSGEAVPTARVAWHSVERTAGAERRAVHSAIVAAGDELGL